MRDILLYSMAILSLTVVFVVEVGIITLLVQILRSMWRDR